jgi:hypothetical protein
MRIFKKQLSNKQFVLVLLLCFLSFSILFVFFVNILVDPFNEYRLLSNRSYRSSISTAFPLFAKLNHDTKYTLVFGTSTSASIDEKCVGDNVLNFSLSLYGEPERIYKALSSLTEHQLSNVDRIYYAFEYNCFHDNEVTDTNLVFSSRFDFVLTSLLNIQKPKIVASLDRIAKTVTGSHDSYIDEFGVYRQTYHRDFSPIFYSDKVAFTHGDRQLHYLSKLVRFAKDKRIDLVIFRTVVSDYFLQHADLGSIQQQYSKVLAAASSFYSLLWLDGISDDLSAFRDPIHPSYDAVLRQMSILTSANSEKYMLRRDALNRYMEGIRNKVLLSERRSRKSSIDRGPLRCGSGSSIPGGSRQRFGIALASQ